MGRPISWDGMRPKTGSKTGSKRCFGMAYAGTIQVPPGDRIRPRRPLSLCVYVYGRARPAPAGPMPLRSPMPLRHAPKLYGPAARRAEMPAVPIGLAATDPAPGSTPVGGVAVYT